MVTVDTVHVVDTVVAPPMGVADTALIAGRFDNGKMWTFEYPPMDYFREAYGFAPDSSWFQHTRLATLRLPNCTASFVSPNGLVLTNHHCGRESVSQVTQSGERLLDEGFFANTLEDERRVEGLYVDQMIAIVDVTAEMDAVQAAQRDATAAGIAARIANEHGGEGIEVEVISLWNGARTSAYVFRRFDDVRLVMTPELLLGQFGGDSDNFTYPRYSLDMTFFRVYLDGRPYQPEYHFNWSQRGVEQGDPVFVIGNPGSTSRLETVAQLEYRRLINDRAILDLYNSRISYLQDYARAFPEDAEERGVRNTVASLTNSQKAYQGFVESLNDPVVMGRRVDNERRFRQAIEQNPELRQRYGDLFEQMAVVQEHKTALGGDFGAFLALTSSSMSSATLRRAFQAANYLQARAAGAPQQRISSIAQGIKSIGSQPAELQTGLLTARLQDLARYLGDTSQVVRSILRGRTPEIVATSILQHSMLADSAAAAAALDGGELSGQDPAVQVIMMLGARYSSYRQRSAALAQQEASIGLSIGRARFDIYGTSEPPDATFSLRIADGRVTPYQYNATVAPVYTTYYGLYDHYHSYGAGTEWDLPDRWLDRPQTFDLSTPLNFVSTNDIVGGNSGSPVINPELEIVGVAFDGNIESLSGKYIYLPTTNRAVSVDVRGMVEALEQIYRADRLVAELMSGRD
jgi:hypothetical protein